MKFLIPLLFLSGCSTLSELPFVGPAFEGVHGAYAETCEMGPIASVRVGQFYVNVACESDKDD